MIEIVMEVDDEFWNILNQLKEFKGQKVLIHCKDCKYWYNDEYETEGYCDLTKYFHMTANDFCSRGVKE